MPFCTLRERDWERQSESLLWQPTHKFKQLLINQEAIHFGIWKLQSICQCQLAAGSTQHAQNPVKPQRSLSHNPHPSILTSLSFSLYTLAVFCSPLIVSLHFLFLPSYFLTKLFFMLCTGEFISNLRGDFLFIDSTSYALKVFRCNFCNFHNFYRYLNAA